VHEFRHRREPRRGAQDQGGQLHDQFRVDAAMSNSFGFGGANATLVFERYQR
jgi:3-oxoacyl-(acyl-carrier-protein) synthase